jgi:hypothetical protein
LYPSLFNNIVSFFLLPLLAVCGISVLTILAHLKTKADKKDREGMETVGRKENMDDSAGFKGQSADL